MVVNNTYRRGGAPNKPRNVYGIPGALDIALVMIYYHVGCHSDDGCLGIPQTLATMLLFEHQTILS